jgi:hypothetical protein
MTVAMDMNKMEKSVACHTSAYCRNNFERE